MRIVRFVDESGAVRLGNELANGTAQPLAGELFGKLTPNGSPTPIKKRLAPLEPANIFCIGLNYREHAAESGQALPERPVIFMKPTTCVIGPGDAIQIPASCDPAGEVDYECELAVVIGKAARNVSVADALKYVLGYTAANDVSARKWQKAGGGGQWIRGKSFDTFCPLGPVLVTADEITDPMGLRIRTVLNGQTMQDHTTGDMIFSVSELVSRLSQDTTLRPGTIILTGTPQGVGMARTPPVWLKPGDEVTVELERVGALTNPVTAA